MLNKDELKRGRLNNCVLSFYFSGVMHW